MQWNRLAFVSDRYLFRTFKKYLFLPVNLIKLSIFNPTKFRNAQIKMFICIPCHKKTNVKHKNEASNLLKFDFNEGT